MHPTTVYIYGPSATVNSRLVRKVFGTVDGVCMKGNLKIRVIDGFYYTSKVAEDVDWYILVGDEAPDNIVMPLDHIFCIYDDKSLAECREFLESIYGA